MTLLSLLCCLQLHATGAHQALLARFNTALAHITGWRVVFKARSGTSINNSTQLHTSSPSAASSSNKKAKVEPQCGHPAALTLQALRSSGGWACGCVMMQRQEQSCWVRFKLPPELTADAEVAAAVRSKQLVSIRQAGHTAGLCCWMFWESGSGWRAVSSWQPGSWRHVEPYLPLLLFFAALLLRHLAL